MTEAQDVLIRSAEWLEANPDKWARGQCYNPATGERCALGVLGLIGGTTSITGAPEFLSSGYVAADQLALYVQDSDCEAENSYAVVSEWNDTTPGLTAAIVAAQMRRAAGQQV